MVFAMGALMCIPSAIDGLLKGRVIHFSKWTVRFVYIGATSVAITFIFAILLIFPFKGSYLAFGKTNFFLHLICPILAVIFFSVMVEAKEIPAKKTILGMAFFILYAIEYEYQVLGVGEANGGARRLSA